MYQASPDPGPCTDFCVSSPGPDFIKHVRPGPGPRPDSTNTTFSYMQRNVYFFIDVCYMLPYYSIIDFFLFLF